MWVVLRGVRIGLRPVTLALKAGVIGFIALYGGLGVERSAQAEVLAINAPVRVQLASIASYRPQLPGLSVSRPNEPFTLTTNPVSSGGVLRKWRRVQDGLLEERSILSRCRDDVESCTLAATRFLAIVDAARQTEGRARIEAINSAINLAIRPVTDQEQYGVPDLWATPLMTFTTEAGDCEDYAIAKYQALAEAGFSAEDLRLVLVHDNAVDDDHAVLAVRSLGQWLILDNRAFSIMEDAEARHLTPLFVLNNEGVERAATIQVKLKVTPAAARNISEGKHSSEISYAFVGPSQPFLL